MTLIPVHSVTLTPVYSVASSITYLLFFRNVPFRIRVRCNRKRNEDEDSPHKFYTLVTHVVVDSFKGVLPLCVCVCDLALNVFFCLPFVAGLETKTVDSEE